MTPHLEELTISIAMDNTELLITNVYIPPASSCNGCYLPPLDHILTCRFISAGRLQCTPFTLALRNNLYKRIPAGGLSHHFQRYSPKYRFTYKASWECRLQFSRCIISISLSHHLVQMANTHDHELRLSTHPYGITYKFHLIFCPAQNLHQPQEG